MKRVRWSLPSTSNGDNKKNKAVNTLNATTFSCKTDIITTGAHNNATAPLNAEWREVRLCNIYYTVIHYIYNSMIVYSII